MNSGLIYDGKPSVHAYIETSRLHRPDMRLCHTQSLRPVTNLGSCSLDDIGGNCKCVAILRLILK